jgi:hypothetical protein
VNLGFILFTFVRDDVFTHFSASIFSAVVSTLGTQPIDVMKTRMMNQPFDQNGRYSERRKPINFVEGYCIVHPWIVFNKR